MNLDKIKPSKSSRVIRYPANLVGRDFVVGDIHGCLDVLHRGLKALNFRPTVDRLFSVGDLVDRGPDSILCLGLLKMKWFHSVLGNHESFLIRHLEKPEIYPPADKSWLDKTGQTFTERKTFAKQWLPLLYKLPYVIQVGGDSGFQIIHAELLEDGASVSNEIIETWGFLNRKKAAERVLGGRSLIRTWLSGKPVMRAHEKSLKITFCGHTIVQSPLQLSRQIYLDGGAFLGYTHSHFDENGSYAIQGKPSRPGLFFAEPAQNKFWFVPTQPHGGANLEPVDLIIPDTH